MKLGLISPRSLFIENTDIVNDSDIHDLVLQYFKRKGRNDASKIQFSIGPALPLLAALAARVFDTIEIINGNRVNIDFDKNYDVVGISLMTVQADEGYRIAQEFRKRGVYVVLGGVHPTLLPDEAMNYADTIILGEAEETWPLFIQDYLKGTARRIYKQESIADIKSSPLPRYDLLSPEYSGYVYIQTSRGCPYDCNYCSVPLMYGHKYRHKTIRQALTEIESVRSIFPNAHLFFSDDNMFVHRKRAKELLRAIIPLKIKWATQADIKIADDAGLLELIALSGCEYVFVGLESVTEGGISFLSKWKSNLFKDYPEKIKKVQSHGIRICGAFIVGTDDHDHSISGRILQFAEDVSLDYMHASILTPYPATAIRKRLAKQKRLLNMPWSNYNFFSVNFEPKLMSPKELQRELMRTLLEFESNPQCEIIEDYLIAAEC